MSNWDRGQSSSSSYQQNYDNFYQAQTQPDSSSQIYGSYYQYPNYNSLLNGSQDVFRNGYQSGHSSNPTSAEEFFRMYQEQQQTQQQHQQEQYPQSIDHDSGNPNYQIPTMVFPSSNSNSGPPEVTHVKRKSNEPQRSGGSGRFGNRNNHGDRNSFGERNNHGDRNSFGERNNFGAIPKQNIPGNNYSRRGNYNKKGNQSHTSSHQQNHRDQQQNHRDQQQNHRDQHQNHRDQQQNHKDQQQNHREQQSWAAIPNEDIIVDGSKSSDADGKPYNNNKRGKNYNQRNTTRYNNYPRDNNGVSRPPYNKSWRVKTKPSGGEETQRDRLTSQLYSGALECLVCCERMRHSDPVWSCPACHHVLHLRCTVKWASSSRAENGWRCPACQNVTFAIPTDYKCMCGKVTNPQWVRGETPHTCGQVCGKDRGCPHQCTLLCHPGPCPPCAANIDRYCGCGRTKQVVQCSSRIVLTCEAKCDKLLNCNKHTCRSGCHSDPCDTCDDTIEQFCYCGKEDRYVSCDERMLGTEYGCRKVCEKTLDCGNHTCKELCHPGPCKTCMLSPASVLSCPCGKSSIPSGARKSCLDPIPLCESACEKLLSCGQPEKRHTCAAKCHVGDCPPCPGTSSVRCRCGAMAKDMACASLDSRLDDARCSKRCTKKRSCGRHKCNQNCCIEINHICPIICNKTMTCGQHKCQELCHRGNCRPCLAASFTELSCECGLSLIYPPVPCGTRPPECKGLCSRNHPCGHPATHYCHSMPQCPPCSVLTSRYCYGAHELRKTVPCHMGDYSCGRACNKPLECGHSCIRLCHEGPCTPEGSHCSQPCPTPRPSCGHPCALRCHPGSPCAPQPCQSKVEVKCECGRRVVSRSCSENNSEYQRLATAQLASKMAEVNIGKTIDLRTKPSKLVLKLECSDECKLAERNLRLAIGLQISNPDLSSKLQPRYSPFLISWAKKDPKFAQNVHDKLTEVVQLAKTSKQKSRSYSFPSMKSEKRQFIHEYSDHFGVESVAYDAEPNRNVVATAYRDKSWLPSYSILETLERAAGKRKVPSLLPSLKKDSKDEESMMVPVRLRPKPAEAKPEEAKSDEPPAIDYFDYVNPS